MEINIDFLIIGSAKCATNSIHNYLYEHEDVYMFKKDGWNSETGVFLKDTNQKIKGIHNRQLKKNLSFFFQNYNGEKIIGECSTDYTKIPFRDVDYDMIHRHNSNMKIVMCVKDPIDKILSQYYQHISALPKLTNKDFEKEFKENEDYYIKTSMFFYQLKPFLKKFQIHIVSVDNLKVNENEEMEKLYNFLGLKCVHTEYKVHHKNTIRKDYVRKDIKNIIGDHNLKIIYDDFDKLKKIRNDL